MLQFHILVFSKSYMYIVLHIVRVIRNQKSELCAGIKALRLWQKSKFFFQHADASKMSHLRAKKISSQCTMRLLVQCLTKTWLWHFPLWIDIFDCKRPPNLPLSQYVFTSKVIREWIFFHSYAFFCIVLAYTRKESKTTAEKMHVCHDTRFIPGI